MPVPALSIVTGLAHIHQSPQGASPAHTTWERQSISFLKRICAQKGIPDNCVKHANIRALADKNHQPSNTKSRALSPEQRRDNAVLLAIHLSTFDSPVGVFYSNESQEHIDAMLKVQTQNTLPRYKFHVYQHVLHRITRPENLRHLEQTVPPKYFRMIVSAMSDLVTVSRTLGEACGYEFPKAPESEAINWKNLAVQVMQITAQTAGIYNEIAASPSTPSAALDHTGAAVFQPPFASHAYQPVQPVFKEPGSPSYVELGVHSSALDGFRHHDIEGDRNMEDFQVEGALRVKDPRTGAERMLFLKQNSVILKPVVGIAALANERLRHVLVANKREFLSMIGEKMKIHLPPVTPERYVTTDGKVLSATEEVKNLMQIKGGVEPHIDAPHFFPLLIVPLLFPGVHRGDFFLQVTNPELGKRALNRVVAVDVEGMDLSVHDINLRLHRVLDIYDLVDLYLRQTKLPPKEIYGPIADMFEDMSRMKAGELKGNGVDFSFLKDITPEYLRAHKSGIIDMITNHRTEVQGTYDVYRAFHDLQQKAEHGLEQLVYRRLRNRWLNLARILRDSLRDKSNMSFFEKVHIRIAKWDCMDNGLATPEFDAILKNPKGHLSYVRKLEGFISYKAGDRYRVLLAALPGIDESRGWTAFNALLNYIQANLQPNVVMNDASHT